jgi:hypothetical protein
MKELFDFFSEMVRAIYDLQEDLDDSCPDFRMVRATRFLALIALKFNSGLGLIKKPEAFRLDDLSRYDAIDFMPKEDDGWSVDLDSDLAEEVLEGGNNGSVSHLIPSYPDFVVFDDNGLLDSYWYEEVNDRKENDEVDKDESSEACYAADIVEETLGRLPASIRRALWEIEDANAGSDGAIGCYRLTIIKSALIGEALSRAKKQEGDVECELLVKLISSRLFLTNYFVGWWYTEDIVDGEWWCLIPNVFDYESGSGNENTDFYQNPLFPLMCHMAIELSRRICAKENSCDRVA